MSTEIGLWHSDAGSHEPDALAKAAEQALSRDWGDPQLRSEEGIRQVFDGMQALLLAEEKYDYVAQLAEADQVVEQCLSEQPSELWPLKARIELDRLTSSLEPYDPEFFSGLPRLIHLLKQVSANGIEDLLQREDQLTKREALVLAQSLTVRAGFLSWIQHGDNLAKHTQQEQELAFRLEHELVEGVRLQIERVDIDVEVKIILVQGLASHSLSVGDAHEGIHWRMRMLELLPTAPGHSAVELADVRLDLGELYLNLSEWSLAIEAFGQAYDGYVAAGEAFEMHAAQAESWVEQARELAASRAAP